MPGPAPGPIPLATTRGLLGASFDLLTRAGPAMRRASFYVGLVVLGTVGPWVVAENLLVAAYDATDVATADAARLADLAGAEGPAAILGFIALAGLLVAAVESRTLAAGVLGGRMAGRPVPTRVALQRSRQTFWRAVVVSIVVAVPISVVQLVATTILEPVIGLAPDVAVVPSTLVSAVVGAPFAYALCGVVLGDVDPFESVRRSWKVFKARPAAAVVIALFESITILLVVVGLLAGFDLALRLFGLVSPALGAGTAARLVSSLGLLALAFAFGTLLFTVTAITVAPQVVMFVGLTHATIWLDRVATVRPGEAHGRFGWLTLPMRASIAIGALCLGLVILALRP